MVRVRVGGRVSVGVRIEVRERMIVRVRMRVSEGADALNIHQDSRCSHYTQGQK